MHTSLPPATTPTSTHIAASLAAVVLLGLALGGLGIVSAVRIAPSAVPAEMSVPSGAGSTGKRSLSASTHQGLQRSGSGPAWNTLSARQKEILTPLRERWSSMGDVAKRRWMSLADGFDDLSAEQQQKLHNRMESWASLSAQQRNQARLNFFASKQLTPEELQSKWDAYQALSNEEKKKLAAKAKPKNRGAATSLRPARRKLADIPAASTRASQNVANPPKISLPLPEQKPVVVTSPPPAMSAPVPQPMAEPAVTLQPLAVDAPLEPPHRDEPALQFSHPDYPPVHPPQ